MTFATTLTLTLTLTLWQMSLALFYIVLPRDSMYVIPIITSHNCSLSTSYLLFLQTGSFLPIGLEESDPRRWCLSAFIQPIRSIRWLSSYWLRIGSKPTFLRIPRPIRFHLISGSLFKRRLSLQKSVLSELCSLEQFLL